MGIVKISLYLSSHVKLAVLYGTEIFLAMTMTSNVCLTTSNLVEHCKIRGKISPSISFFQNLLEKYLSNIDHFCYIRIELDTVNEHYSSGSKILA